MMDIDYVITYVDAQDAHWKKLYKLYKNDEELVRFRSWDNLQYIFRGIENFMPFIRNIYLVVSGKSQIPEWVNLSMINIITHDLIIPPEFLPTFNSTTIELFLYKIPGLSEYFIYGNDDMFPINSLTEEDFFLNNLPKLHFYSKPYNPQSSVDYRHHLHNGENAIRSLLNLPKNDKTINRTGHSLHPMLKSTWNYIWENINLNNTISQFRKKSNVNQDIVAYFLLLTNNFIPSLRKTSYLEFKNINKVKYIIENSEFLIVCLNDNKSINFEKIKSFTNTILSGKFPNKSKYEL